MTNLPEIFLPHPTIPYLSVSDQGQVKCLGHISASKVHAPRMLPQKAKANGHVYVCFERELRVARLVLETFEPRFERGTIVFIDGNRSNVALSNLMWKQKKERSQPKAFFNSASDWFVSATLDQMNALYEAIRSGLNHEVIASRLGIPVGIVDFLANEDDFRQAA